MAKQDTIEFANTAMELQTHAIFRVKREDEHAARARASGQTRKNRIRVLAGDRVKVEMTPDDPGTGRIPFRFK
ncbi:MAG: translation initiation factor IF-1 [Alphaproteobacteria bacterium]|nr:translation initiation factor IF-1 [Alphaproteobacteria bacterium]